MGEIAKLPLFAGKQLGERDTDIFNHSGNGSITFLNNEDTLSVGVGQYYIKQSKQIIPYFEGKIQTIELTTRNFHIQAGVIKQIGLFSSSGSAPFTANKDGYIIETNGDTSEFSLVAINNGVETVRVDSANFNGDFNPTDFNNLDLSKFQVFRIKFLWLGGALFTLEAKIKNEWQLLHSAQWDGAELADTFGGSPIVKSPNQFVRYEIRSTTGTGSLTYVCSEVSTDDVLGDSGKSISIFNATSLNTNNPGTIYALKGIKKNVVSFRDAKIQILDFSVGITASTDSGIILLLLNPVHAVGVIAYANKSKFQEGTAPANATVTIGANTRVLKSFPINSQSSAINFSNDYMNSLGINIDNTLDEIVLCYAPTTNNQVVNGAINLKVY